MAVLFSDDFTRANNATSPGSPLTGGPYTVRNSGVAGISSNRLYMPTASTSGAGTHITMPGDENVDFTAVMATLGADTVGLIFRWIDSSNFMVWGPSTTAWRMAVVRNGGFTSVGFGGPAPVNGDVARVVAHDRWLHGYVNGTKYVSVEDPVYDDGGTTIGFLMRNNTVRVGGATSQAIDSTDPYATPLEGSMIKSRTTRAIDDAS